MYTDFLQSEQRERRTLINTNEHEVFWPRKGAEDAKRDFNAERQRNAEERTEEEEF